MSSLPPTWSDNFERANEVRFIVFCSHDNVNVLIFRAFTAVYSVSVVDS